jgi:hypothetical protein
MAADLWTTLSALWSLLVIISPVVSAIALVLAATGGVPEIRRYMASKPRLKLIILEVARSTQPMGFYARVKVVNEKKRLRRNMDAETVIATLHVLDRTHRNWGAAYNMSISPFLMSGLDITTELQFAHNFISGQQYTIIVRVTCNGLNQWIRNSTNYVAP